MSLSTLFNFKKKSLNLTEPSTTLKGQYLGNISTNVAKGEKCVDRPLNLLWNNYQKTSGKQTVSMKITVDNSGLKVYTTNQGLTHYWCHRISYFRVASNNPKLFVWIYRHASKKLKVELRCHAILLANEKKAKGLVELLTKKVAASLQEYRREKTLKHRRRLLHDKAAAHLSQHGESPVQARTKLLATSSNYKPPTEYSLTSPTLTAISEEVDCSSSDESDYGGSPYSTLGRWTFNKNGFGKPGGSEPATPDVNMNQLPDDGECDSLNFESVDGFATLPRKSRSNSSKRMQKFLVDRLETLVMQGETVSALDQHLSDSDEDEFELEGDSDEDSGAGSHTLSGAEASPLTARLKESHPEHLEGPPHEETTPTAQHQPGIAHLRSFSDGFYSFDKSSISSDCSEASIDKQKVLLQSRNHVSSESGVGSIETLAKPENPLSNSSEKPVQEQNVEDSCALIPQAMPMRLHQDGAIFYVPSNNHSLVKASVEKDFESDCSDSSVEVIRIVTRL